MTGLIIAACLGAMAGAATPPKTIMTIFIDDLGFYDTAVYNENAPTPHLANLSHAEGMILSHHYTYKYCSPTRRGFLSGRFPVHMTGMQAQPCTNWLPLDMTLLSQKFKSIGSTVWRNHFVGKGHLGYQTTDHLPVNRGFDSHVGYLAGAETYFYGNNTSPDHDCDGKPADCRKDFWFNDGPAPNEVIMEVFYSTNYYTERTLEILKNHTPSESLWIHLTYQGVHSPYSEPPEWEQIPNGTGFWDQTFGSMLQVVDRGINNITTALKAADRWNDALIMISSDNGGIGPGNNYPLRGKKAEPWEGGTRVMAFLTGGYLPSSLYGTTSPAFISVADWYPTLCTVAGASDCSDPVSRNGQMVDIDGVNQWPRLTGQTNDIGHEYLPTTEAGIIWKEQYKLVLGAPSTDWYDQNCTHIPDNRTAWPCVNGGSTELQGCSVCSEKKPCLFDLSVDESERVNIADQNPSIVSDLQAKLSAFTAAPQANASIDPAVLSRDYTCVTDIRPWWGDFSGPCCKRKTQSLAEERSETQRPAEE